MVRLSRVREEVTELRAPSLSARSIILGAVSSVWVTPAMSSSAS